MAAAPAKKPFLLTVEPNELVFSVPSDRKNVDPGRITITNPNNSSFGFKIKTTAPQQFCVKPCLGRIDAGQTVSVEVRLSAFDPKKVKFLVQAVDCQPDEDSNQFSARFVAPDTAEHLIRGVVYVNEAVGEAPVAGAASATVSAAANELMQTAQAAPVATSTPQSLAATLPEPLAVPAPAAAVPAPAGLPAPTIPGPAAPIAASTAAAASAPAAAFAAVAPALSSGSDAGSAGAAARPDGQEKSKEEAQLKSLGIKISSEQKDSAVIIATNLREGLVAYKIKTTAPKDFLVKPSCGVLQSREQASITVTPNDPANISTKAKFQVNAVVIGASENVTNTNVTDFFKTVDPSRLEERKLRLPFGDVLPVATTGSLAAPAAPASAPAPALSVASVAAANPTVSAPPVTLSKASAPATATATATATAPTPAPAPAPASIGASTTTTTQRSLAPSSSFSAAPAPAPASSVPDTRFGKEESARRKAESPAAATAGGEMDLLSNNNLHALLIVLFAFLLGVLFGYFVLA